MTPLTIALAIVYIVLALFIISFVLLQHSKSANLPGAIAGGAETFFGKNKGRSIDAKLGKATTIISILFVILTIVLNIIQ